MRGSPLPLLFSTSNGYTENSEDVWAKPVPYLRSVSSPWDKQLAPRYTDTVTLSRQSVFDRLGLSRTAIAASTGGGYARDSYTLQDRRASHQED